MTPRQPTSRPVIGWREWIAFPDLGIAAIKAKIDTGARTSSLHASHIRRFQRDGREWVSFEVHPLQRNNRTTISAEAPLIEHRMVRSTSGHETVRPVIETVLLVGGIARTIELTLSNRDAMGFRLLLGRRALRRFHIDPSRSYLTAPRPKDTA